MNRKFRPLYGRDHEKTQRELKKNSESNPSLTPDDIERFAAAEKERKSKKGGLHDWGPSWQKSDGEQ